MEGYTGNSKVDLMAKIQIMGNVTPQMWYRTITRENGKPHLLAIAILSDIVYWYRPFELRDELTGHVLGYRKKFKADMLQRSYDQFAEVLGESKRNVTDAMARLEALGIIKREFRTVEIAGMRRNNILFIDICIEQLCRFTFPAGSQILDTEDMTEMASSPPSGPSKSLGDHDGGQERCRGDSTAGQQAPCHAIRGEGATLSGERVSRHPGTDIEDTTENTTEMERCRGDSTAGQQAPCHAIRGEGATLSGERVSRHPGTDTENTTENTTEMISSSSSSSPPRSPGDMDDDDQIQRYRSAAAKEGYAPAIIDAVAVELRGSKYMPVLTERMFLALCQSISERAPMIANISPYIRKCIANIVRADRLAGASAGHRIRAQDKGSSLLQLYGAEGWDAFEEQILSNA